MMNVGGPSPLWAASSSLDGQVGLGCVSKLAEREPERQEAAFLYGSFLDFHHDGLGSINQTSIPSFKLLLIVCLSQH